ncbi:MAG: S4 domain-containing protein YaaA [Alicyclobacillus sp.]|nr:S4 domain-containing protein YaaA [Alicyclobacillus sp.]
MDIHIHTDYITLGQVLKVTEAIQSGGEAKAYLHEHVVMVNGTQETRRGRKLRDGDRLQIDENVFHIRRATP